MTEYKHVEVSSGFTLSGENGIMRIPGKRKWYAPWLRHPDRIVDATKLIESAISRARNSI